MQAAAVRQRVASQVLRYQEGRHALGLCSQAHDLLAVVDVELPVVCARLCNLGDLRLTQCRLTITNLKDCDGSQGILLGW